MTTKQLDDAIDWRWIGYGTYEVTISYRNKIYKCHTHNTMAIDYIPDGYSRAEVTANTTDDKWSFVKNRIISMQGHKDSPKFIVIDNITNGFGSIYSAKKMSKFVMDMKTLKERYGLTILLIAHCPKRNKRKPLDQDSLGGSKMILNFADSAFAIGTSFQDEGIRYVKQV